MQPAFSVVFLTVLIGAGQGLFLALIGADALGRLDRLGTRAGADLLATGSALAVALMTVGLGASFLHLGHPERAWRAASMWRTSWLSREVIALPVTIALVALYGLAHWMFAGAGSAVLGGAGALAAVALFICTGMIYACIRFLPEWATPLTVANFTALGIASGLTLASALAALQGNPLARDFALAAMAATAAAFVVRAATLARNARLAPAATLANAIGVRHTHINQQSRGFTGSSFNTRDFFHGVSTQTLKAIRWGFLVAVFAAPLVLLGVARIGDGATGFVLACSTQMLGLVAERWHFFAASNHVQNVYYQRAG